MKGASGYVGVSRLHYACYFIPAHFVANHFDKMMEYYPTLVETAIEFKLYSKKIIAEFNGDSYEPTAEDESTFYSS